MMKKVEIYTDGSCLGNPGPGGWCAILKIGEHEKVLKGGDYETTNNIMELSAVCGALDALKKPCDVTVYSDSQYVCNAFNNGWIENWKKNGWKNSKKEPVANHLLWNFILQIIRDGKHNVSFVWVKGHAENEYNNRCDVIAREMAQHYQNLPDNHIEIIG